MFRGVTRSPCIMGKVGQVDEVMSPFVERLLTT